MAGAEGIEPPIALLERAVIPINYAPRLSYYTKNMLKLKLLLEYRSGQTEQTVNLPAKAFVGSNPASSTGPNLLT